MSAHEGYSAMRRAAKVDANQRAIIKALEKIGCDVVVIGYPVDVLCGYRCHNYMLEIKNPLGRNRLTSAQKEFIESWRGQVRVVRSVDEAIRLVTGAYANS
jgi:hypothetical protein